MTADQARKHAEAEHKIWCEGQYERVMTLIEKEINENPHRVVSSLVLEDEELLYETDKRLKADGYTVTLYERGEYKTDNEIAFWHIEWK
jgi:hypothetical protein